MVRPRQLAGALLGVALLVGFFALRYADREARRRSKEVPPPTAEEALSAHLEGRADPALALPEGEPRSWPVSEDGSDPLPRTRLVLKIVDSRGEPIAGVEGSVRTREPIPFPVLRQDAEFRTNDVGETEALDAPSGRVNVRAIHRRGWLDETFVVPEKPSPVELKLRPGRVVRGSVVLDRDEEWGCEESPHVFSVHGADAPPDGGLGTAVTVEEGEAFVIECLPTIFDTLEVTVIGHDGHPVVRVPLPALPPDGTLPEAHVGEIHVADGRSVGGGLVWADDEKVTAATLVVRVGDQTYEAPVVSGRWSFATMHRGAERARVSVLLHGSRQEVDLGVRSLMSSGVLLRMPTTKDGK